MEFSHVPVMPTQVSAGLQIQPDGIYLDCTLGAGGHSLEILQKLNPKGRLVALDQDPEAIAAAAKKLAAYRERFVLLHTNFKHLLDKLKELGIKRVQGVLFDLGVSSHQFNDPARGFSYWQDAALDMRMNPGLNQTAGDLVNKLPEKELARILKEYGEERWADRIARFICAERKRRPIVTTFELVEVIKRAVPAAARRNGPHPARRSFQALRIQTNQELEILENAVRDAVSVLSPGGRICVISFQSLEDRIIKKVFRELAAPCTCPVDFPVCVCGREKALKIITPKPLTPSAAELSQNPRARSAKLRVGEKC